MERKTIQDADALLLYRVGPVYCCSPTLSVESVIMPPRLTHPPGSSQAEPGMFKFSSGIVRTVDLRQRFGVAKENWEYPGRVVIVEVEGGHAGFWVDEIIDVIHFPESGWGIVPAHIPRNIFSRTLLLNSKIQLYADFENLNNFREVGYLREYIELLQARPAGADIDKMASTKAGSRLAAESPHVITEKESVSPSSVEAKKVSDISAEVAQAKAKAREREREREKNTHTYQSPAVVRDAVNPDVQKNTDLKERSEQSKASRSASHSPASGIESLSASANFNNSIDKTPEKQMPAQVSDSMLLKRASIEQQHPVKEYTARYSQNKPSNNDAGESGDDSSMWVLATIFMLVLVGVIYFINDLFFNIDNLTAEREFPVLETKSTVTAVVPEAEQDVQLVNEAALDGIAESEQHEKEEAVVINEPSGIYRATIDKNEEGVVIVLNQPVTDMGQVLNDSADSASVVESGGKQENEYMDDVDDQQPVVPVVDDRGLVEDKGGDKDRLVVVESKPSSELESQPLAVKEAKQPDFIVHVVVKGDTLWHIAKRYIHNPFRYPELARLSKIKNPDLIYPGDKVKIVFNNR